LTTKPRSEPANRLPIATRTMWWCETAAIAAVLAVVAAMAATSADWLAMPVALLVAAGAVAFAVAVPLLRHRRWRWELHDEELDLLHGAWRVVRTIVPTTRIQHVSVERTGWTDAFGLVRLHVHTAAGKTTIPGIERPAADELRDRILAQLRTPDDL
jgi:membrane protein YdbS with pleckstrin-like domain